VPVSKLRSGDFLGWGYILRQAQDERLESKDSDLRGKKAYLPVRPEPVEGR
jgi:hypothetical protein